MPWSISDVADTQYDYTQPWSSMFLGQSADVFKQDPRQHQLMSQAQVTADRATPQDFIRASMTAGMPRDAGPSRPQPTIGSVLDGSALQPSRLYDHAPTDFSGSPASIEASPRNTLSIG